MTDIDTDRQKLHIIMEKMLPLLDENDVGKRSLLAPLRWELARHLFPYLMIDGMRNPRHRASGVLLLDQVRAHFRDWGCNQVEADWSTYRGEATGLIRSIQSHIS